MSGTEAVSGSRSAPALKVALVAPSLEILGGQAVQAHRLLEALGNIPGIEARLLPINPKLPGVVLWMQRVKYLRTLTTSFTYVLSLVRGIPRVDVLHVFSASYLSFVLAPTPALVLARLFQKPVVLHYHSGEAEDHLARWRRTAIPTLKLADQLVVPSEYLRKVFASFGLAAEVIPNSLDLESFKFRSRNQLRPVFLSNRNFETHYGVDTVLQAFALIQRRFPEARLLLAGYGSQRRSLVRLVESLGCSNVSMLGRVPPGEMARLYDEADIFLNASEIDNMPLSIMEAQASGLPIVTSGAGGIPWIAEHEHTALLVQPRRPEQLARAALRLLDEPELAFRLSEKGRENVEMRFGMEQVLPSWVRLYRKMAPDGGSQ
jgi:glycosyltransferase involved in cell wall biosynthesis